MKFKLLMTAILSMLFAFTGILTTEVFAAEYEGRGDIAAGQEYSGQLNKNQYGNNIPAACTLNIPENAIIKVRLYTQTDEDSNLYIFDRDPADSWEYPADTMTKINEFYSNPVAVSSSNYFSVTADKRNDKPYVDMFANISKGNYFVGLTGATYRFQIDLEPLSYLDDESTVNIENTNNKDYALSYSIGNYQEGQMLTNGEAHNIIKENNCYVYLDDDYDFFKFNVAKPGKYTIDFYTDGFLGAGVFILDQSAWTDYGHKWIDAVPENISADRITAAYEDHKNSARMESMEFDITQPGDYLVRISRTSWTAGSYKFRITGEEEVSKDYTQEWKKIFPTYKQFKEEIQSVQIDHEFTVKFNNNIKLTDLTGYVVIWDADKNQPLQTEVMAADAKTLKVKTPVLLEHNKYYYLVIYEGLKSESEQALKQGIVHVFKTI